MNRVAAAFFALAVATVILQLFPRPVDAQSSFDGGIDCSAFQNNADGSWTVLQRAYFPTLYVWVNAGVTFNPGQTFMGNDMAGKLNQACGQASAQPGQSAPPAAGN
jgi:hypothetical protein